MTSGDTSIFFFNLNFVSSDNCIFILFYLAEVTIDVLVSTVTFASMWRDQ